MKLKHMRFNTISLQFTPITSRIITQFQCCSFPGTRLRNNLSSVQRRFSPLCSHCNPINSTAHRHRCEFTTIDPAPPPPYAVPRRHKDQSSHRRTSGITFQH